MSQEEFDCCVLSDEQKTCTATDAAKKSGTATDAGGNCWYWLRSPGENGRNVSAVRSDGSVSSVGLSPASNDTAVRPALWVSID